MLRADKSEQKAISHRDPDRSATPWTFVWSLVVCLLVGLSGCAVLEKDVERKVVWRLIEEEPRQIFAREQLFNTEVTESWTLAEELEDWQIGLDPEEMSLSNGILDIQTVEKRFVSIDRAFGREASEIDALEISVRGLTRQTVQLEWARPGEKYTAERRLTLRIGENLAHGFVGYRFSLADHSEWRGRIERIRFGVVLPRSRQASIDKISALVEKVDADRLAEATGGIYKVSLDGELRNGFLSLPGLPLTRTLNVPPSAELVFALGAIGQQPGDIAHRLRVEADGQSEVLFEEVLPADTQGWQQRQVSLAEYAGREVRLIFETTRATLLDPKLTLPVWGHPKIVAPQPGATPKPNVVLISIDTLRADHLSIYGYERQTSPRIDAWAQQSATVFENAVASAPWTLPSHLSIMTGLDALEHGGNFPNDLVAPEYTLADILRREGYTTMAVSGGGFVHPRYGFAQGFERFRAFGVSMGFEKELEQGLALARRYLTEDAGQPTFLFFHTYEVHNPFRARQPYFTELTGRTEERIVDVEVIPEKSVEEGFVDRRRLRFLEDGNLTDKDADEVEAWALDLYDSGIAYTDALIGELLRDLERLDTSRPTMVILTSDHGELFGEHGLVNHVSLYDGNLLVPLIISDPLARGAGRRVAEQVRSIDILPTVLDLLAIENPAKVDGISLVPLMEGASRDRDPEAELAWSYAPSSNYGVSVRGDNRYKFIFQHGAWETRHSPESFYDLREDPEENASNLTDPQVVTRLRALTEQTLQERLPGLRLRLANQEGAGKIRVEVSGRQIQRNRVKALRVGQEGAQLTEDGRQMIFEVPAGETWLFAFEGQISSPLQLKIDPSAGSPFTGRVDPAELEDVWAARFDQERWKVESSETPEGDGAFVWWHRRAEEEAITTPQIDAELRKQLEALGYVD